VDAALRSRVQEFYQLQVDKKFRQADEFVATDTKDFYFDSKKPEIQAFKIVGIQYAPDFQSAEVKLTTHTHVPLPGAMDNPMETQLISDWKIDGGKWCWHLDREKLLNTPFGRVNPGGAPRSAEGRPNVAQATAQVSADITHAVRAEPAKVSLDQSHPQTMVVMLKNTLPGPVTIQNLTNTPALKVDIAKANLGAEESTQMTITAVAGSTDLPPQLRLRVAPFGQIVVIDLNWASKR
jgi:hypothetical protein